MFKRIACLLCLSCCVVLQLHCAPAPSDQHPLPAFGDNIPEGYELVYEQDFSDDAVWQDFEMSDPKTWRLGETNGDHYLDLFKGVGAYTPQVRSPRSVALLTKMSVGDFVLEVDAESLDIRDGAHRDVCFFLGAQDPSNFYYIHIATAADPNAHNIFLVKDAPRTNIAAHTTSGVAWGTAIRHRIRVERVLEEGTIRVFFNNMETPIMETVDSHFDFGHVGVGSFDNRCRFYHLRLYAPETRPGTENFFD